jgi:hypothetical protein
VVRFELEPGGVHLGAWRGHLGRRCLGRGQHHRHQCLGAIVAGTAALLGQRSRSGPRRHRRAARRNTDPGGAGNGRRWLPGPRR